MTTTTNEKMNEMRESADSLAHQAGDRARHTVEAARRSATQAAERANEMAAEAQARARQAAEQVGDYFSEHNVRGVIDEATSLIRRHPIPAVLIGIGIGAVLAVCMRSQSE